MAFLFSDRERVSDAHLRLDSVQDSLEPRHNEALLPGIWWLREPVSGERGENNP